MSSEWISRLERNPNPINQEEKKKNYTMAASSLYQLENTEKERGDDKRDQPKKTGAFEITVLQQDIY